MRRQKFYPVRFMTMYSCQRVLNHVKQCIYDNRYNCWSILSGQFCVVSLYFRSSFPSTNCTCLGANFSRKCLSETEPRYIFKTFQIYDWLFFITTVQFKLVPWDQFIILSFISLILHDIDSGIGRWWCLLLVVIAPTRG